MVDHRGPLNLFFAAIPARPAHLGFRRRRLVELEQHDVGGIVAGKKTRSRLEKVARLGRLRRRGAIDPALRALLAAIGPHHHHRGCRAGADAAVAGRDQQGAAVLGGVVDQKAGAETDAVDHQKTDRSRGFIPVVAPAVPFAAHHIAVAAADFFFRRLAEPRITVMHPRQVQLELVEPGHLHLQLEHHLLAGKGCRPQTFGAHLLVPDFGQTPTIRGQQQKPRAVGQYQAVEMEAERFGPG